MKTLLTIALTCIGLVGMGQNIKFISHKSFSGGGINYETHTIQIRFGVTDNDCDTLIIDNRKYQVLQHGSTGREENGKYYNWCIDFYGFNDDKGGRWLNNNRTDYDFKCYVYVGKNQINTVANRIYFYNHGASVTYY